MSSILEIAQHNKQFIIMLYGIYTDQGSHILSGNLVTDAGSEWPKGSRLNYDIRGDNWPRYDSTSLTRVIRVHILCGHRVNAVNNAPCNYWGTCPGSTEGSS